ncbi:hypothetical protein A2614_01555 [Candidatus Woesebacteria bacterium RIFOXYD1_FULL_40_21]|uniref:DUF4446 domain-containing protein n=2 Tax=Candidatus Woeseibacteriota TaxID=1752722 RepID=A0A1F8DJM3_9BACT|nr:MAG: hypothetical protein UT72_C0006G0010 [Candidatus Woesebacteria bacterium GW2011_GWB1_40_101]OGM87985.1 MAG: hypothetical protein A2614_01555 [Candidatus Woesebacteria bacterium RIFOXYD1_FULL_40_21]
MSKLQTQIFIFGIVGIWLFLLTLGFFVLISFFRRIGKGAKDLDLRTILDKIIKRQDESIEAIGQVNQEIAKLNQDGVFHIQKIGLVRFNPFKETGGDHSFSLAIMDGDGTGVILTGLHTRERTRLYVKAVKNGKSEFELSKEEELALKKVLKN